MKMIFNYYANKTHFHNKGFALGLVLKVRFFGTRKWPIVSDAVEGDVVVRALASNQDAICGLRLLFVLSFAQRGFSPGTPVFSSP